MPRSILTALRVFVERDDFEIFHEPFSASYYYSEERLSDRYSNVEPKAEYNYQNVLASILEPREKHVFVKGLIGPELGVALREHLHHPGPEVRNIIALPPCGPTSPSKRLVSNSFIACFGTRQRRTRRTS